VLEFVALDTKELEAFFRKTMLLQPWIRSTTANLFAVFVSTTVHMINLQKTNI
jgi:hypothetical protein